MFREQSDGLDYTVENATCLTQSNPTDVFFSNSCKYEDLVIQDPLDYH